MENDLQLLEEFVEDDMEESEQHPAPRKHTSKERFRRYLNKSGVSAAILRGIVSLFEEESKPNDPIRFLCEQLGYGLPETDEVDTLQAEVIFLRKRYAHLSHENERLNVLTVPKPTPADALGLDEETHELLRKQEEQLAKIQHREACILMAYDAAKVKAAKDLKVPVCLHAGANGEETQTSGLEAVKLLAAVEEEEEGEVDEALGLKCSLDLLQDDLSPTESIGDGVTTLTIPMEELKSHPAYTCGMTIQYPPNI